MNPNLRRVLIWGGVAVAAYFAYRWYKNRQQAGGGTGLPQMGTNLNSVAPFLVGGTQGGIQYQPSTTVTIAQTQPAAPPPSGGGTTGGGTKPPQPGGPIDKTHHFRRPLGKPSRMPARSTG